MVTLRIQQAYRGGHNGAPGWWLHVQYDEDAVAMLKSAIPSSQRTWDAEHERWWVSEAQERRLIEIAPGLEAFTKQAALF